MAQSRKREAFLDYPLTPQRRRPWGWLLLAGCVLGVVAFIGWGRVGRPQPPLSSAPPGSNRDRVILRRSTIITPVPEVVPVPTSAPGLALTSGDVVDEVEEVEVAWSEHASRPEVLTYAVQSGDSLWSIASRFDLDVDTLRWSNPELERNPDKLSPGSELVILPVPGIYHVVEAGDTLSAVAKEYGVAQVDILNYPLNGLTSPDDLQVGQRLIIPHGRKELPRPTPQLSPESPFAWPLVGKITQGFAEGHKAIDIGAPYGSAVYAGRAGRVIRSGWARTGYGYTVMIDHGEGLQSLYSHMKGQWVALGDWVERGQLIGEVGSTGNSSGPHVHFEVRANGERVSPLDYLPAGSAR